MRSFNTKNANREDIKKKLSFTKRANINGQNIDKEADKSKYHIMSGMKKLADKGLVTYAADSSDSLAEDAKSLLSVLGVTIDSTLTKEIDLRARATDTETIQNPNIEDKNLKNMKNEKITAVDKFPDTSDSFYNLDAKQRQHIQKKNTSIRVDIPGQSSIQKLAADIAANFDLLNPAGLSASDVGGYSLDGGVGTDDSFRDVTDGESQILAGTRRRSRTRRKTTKGY